MYEDGGGEFDWDYNWNSGDMVLDGDDDYGAVWVSEEAFVLDVERM